MPASITEKIIEKMMDALRAQGIEKVYRSKMSATKLAPGEIVVSVRFAGEESPQFYADRILKREMRVEVTALTQSEAPDQALDETRQRIVRAFMVDRTLGNLAAAISEGATQMSFDDASPPIGEISINFDVLYLAPLGSLTHRVV